MDSSTSIDQACSITTGKLDSNEFVEEGQYPFFTCAKDPIRIDTYAFDSSAILVAGNNANGNFHVNRYTGKFNAYQRTYVLTGKEGVDLDYVFYALRLLLRELKERSQGSQTKFLTIGLLRDLEFRRRQLSEQKKIAKVLSNLDAKIDLNNRINEELEGLAKLLYDYWFVQFDFPISAARATAMGDPALEGKPYRQSGGKMVYNQTLKREIPEGWGGGSILDVAKLGGGGTPSKEREEWWNGDIPFFTPTDTTDEIFCLRTEDKITDEGLRKSAAKLYPAGTLFITARGSVGRVVITDCDSSMSQSCYALMPNEGVSKGFLYYHIHALMGYLKAKSSGSVFKSIVTNDLKFSPSVVPSTEVMRSFDERTAAIFSQILNNQKQNQHLTELRDWLLPMLMNGQVTVGDPQADSPPTQQG